MTRLAGIDVHALVSDVAQQVDLPQVTLRQGGDMIDGFGVVTGDEAVFIPPNVNVRPRVGDHVEFNGAVRMIRGISGLEDGWSFRLAEQGVGPLGDASGLQLEFEAIGGGRVLLIRTDPGSAKVEGNWRASDDGPANTFSMTRRNLILDTGPGKIVFDVWRVASDGTSTDASRAVVTAT